MQEMVGEDVAKVQYSGTTEREKDASCCQQCSADPECEFWVRATDTSDCWLKRGFQEEQASNKRLGALRVEASASCQCESIDHSGACRGYNADADPGFCTSIIDEQSCTSKKNGFGQLPCRWKEDQGRMALAPAIEDQSYYMYSPLHVFIYVWSHFTIADLYLCSDQG